MAMHLNVMMENMFRMKSLCEFTLLPRDTRILSVKNDFIKSSKTFPGNFKERADAAEANNHLMSPFQL